MPNSKDYNQDYYLKHRKQLIAKKRAYYVANKDKILPLRKEMSQRYADANKMYRKEYLESHSCVDCGENDPIVLSFDHVRGIKSFTLAKRVWCVSPKRFKKEIEKCEVRCANCHRRRHFHLRKST